MHGRAGIELVLVGWWWRVVERWRAARWRFVGWRRFVGKWIGVCLCSVGSTDGSIIRIAVAPA
jgi:hypothetical protein